MLVRFCTRWGMHLVQSYSDLIVLVPGKSQLLAAPVKKRHQQEIQRGTSQEKKQLPLQLRAAFDKHQSVVPSTTKLGRVR